MASRQVGISLLALSPHRMAGATTYTVGLTRALVARAPGHHTLFVPKRYERFWTEILPSSANFVVTGPDPDHRVLRVLYEQAVLPDLAAQHGVDTLFFPHLFAPRWKRPHAVVTVYDLLFLSKKTDFPWYKRAYHRWAYQRVAQSSAHLITISEFCRRDIIQRFDLPADRVSVAPPGLDPEFVVRSEHPGQLLGLPDRYILSVAGAYPHKRLPTLLEAFALLCRDVPDLHLVCAGTHAGNRGVVHRLLASAEMMGVLSRVRLLPKLERTDMLQLFLGALALVSASEFEGFGIPIIEAMAVGCPVAATPATAVTEVLGGCGWLARDLTAPALAEALQQAVAGRGSDPGRIVKAKARVQTMFTWERAAAAVEAVFARVRSHGDLAARLNEGA